MLNKPLLSSLLLGGQAASATYLYVASYSGALTTLSFAEAECGNTLVEVASTQECATAPSWLTLDASKNVLYCADEGFGTWPNGNIVAFAPLADGSLEVISKELTFVGAVSFVLYGENDTGLGVAY